MKNTFYQIVKQASIDSGVNMGEYYKSKGKHPENFTNHLKWGRFDLAEMKDIIEFYGGDVDVIVSSKKLGKIKCNTVADIYASKLNDACKMMGLTLSIKFKLKSGKVLALKIK